MDDAVLAELRALRARAYGPDADIASDPAALERLRELEAPRTAVAVADPHDEPPGRPEGPANDSDHPAERALGGPTAPPPAASAAPPRPQRRRLIALWAASVVVASLLGAGVAAALSTPASPVRGAHYFATLAEDRDFVAPWLLTSGGQQLRGFDDYHGLTPVLSDVDWSGVGADECLLLMATSDLTGREAESFGTLAWGCGSGPFAAAISLTVDDTSPESLRRMFPDGTALQFVLAGDEVRVFLADPRATPAA